MTDSKKEKMNITFEEALAEMEKAVTKLEEPSLSFSDSLDTYEHFAELYTYCQEQLNSGQKRIMDIDERIRELSPKSEEEEEDEE